MSFPSFDCYNNNCFKILWWKILEPEYTTLQERCGEKIARRECSHPAEWPDRGNRGKIR